MRRPYMPTDRFHRTPNTLEYDHIFSPADWMPFQWSVAVDGSFHEVGEFPNDMMLAQLFLVVGIAFRRHGDSRRHLLLSV